MVAGFWAQDLPGSFRQDLQDGKQRPLHLPERAEDRFFEGPTCTSKTHGTVFSTNEDELPGDEPRQFANLENAVGCAVVDHGGLFDTA